MTLRHILNLSGYKIENATKVNCPKCQSLFEEIPYNRVCEEAGISIDKSNWCSCASFNVTDKSDPIVYKLSKFIVQQINIKLQNYLDIDLCAKLTLNEITSARKSETINDVYSEYVIAISTLPSNAAFEATVREYKTTGKIKVLGTIGRINAYAEESDCITDKFLRNYCYCIR